MRLDHHRGITSIFFLGSVFAALSVAGCSAGSDQSVAQGEEAEGSELAASANTVVVKNVIFTGNDVIMSGAKAYKVVEYGPAVLNEGDLGELRTRDYAAPIYVDATLELLQPAKKIFVSEGIEASELTNDYYRDGFTVRVLSISPTRTTFRASLTRDYREPNGYDRLILVPDSDGNAVKVSYQSPDYPQLWALFPPPAVRHQAAPACAWPKVEITATVSKHRATTADPIRGRGSISVRRAYVTGPITVVATPGSCAAPVPPTLFPAKRGFVATAPNGSKGFVDIYDWAHFSAVPSGVQPVAGSVWITETCRQMDGCHAIGGFTPKADVCRPGWQAEPADVPVCNKTEL